VPWLRLFFAVGFLGGYTTFSTYTFESLGLLEARAYLAAVANVAGSVLLGMVAVIAGYIWSGALGQDAGKGCERPSNRSVARGLVPRPRSPAVRTVLEIG
jgi:hypothetical protein